MALIDCSPQEDLGETLSSKTRVTLMSLSTMEKIQVGLGWSKGRALPNYCCCNVLLLWHPDRVCYAVSDGTVLRWVWLLASRVTAASVKVGHRHV